MLLLLFINMNTNIMNFGNIGTSAWATVKTAVGDVVAVIINMKTNIMKFNHVKMTIIEIQAHRHGRRCYFKMFVVVLLIS
ncbi:hypothetical protein T492DRAFT_217847 [Pavlovales sp. CCMP2436]|nr:hypothetical protein T492DRAFT_217847 [Pavlovales sp. CCMP2436]